MGRLWSLATIIALLLLVPSTAFAQGFEFGEDEVEPVDEAAEEEAADDGGGMTFDTEEVEDATQYSDQGETPSVAVVAVPGPAMDPDRRQKIQAELDEIASEIPNIIVVGPETVLPGLEAQGLDDCVTEPLCLATVGEEGNVDRILIARVKEREDGLELATDYFDVDDKLFIKYHSVTGLGGTGALVDAVEPSLHEIFGVRDVVEGPTIHDDDANAGQIQSILAYTTAGLAVVSVGAGVVFGLQARSIQNEVEDSSQNEDGVYEMTQVAAANRLQEAEARATTANIFYGIGLALGATSALLFYIEGGEDVATEEELSARGVRDLRVAPVLTPEGFGVGAGFSF